MIESEVFTIQARRCKRCGGLLTSDQAIRDGYGACCLRKVRKEERAKEEAENQCSLFDRDHETVQTADRKERLTYGTE